MQVTSLVNVPRPIFDSIVFHLSCESIENNFITFRSFVRNLVKNKLVPDPFYGLGNESIIDIVDSLVDLNFWAIIVLLKSYRNGHKEVLPKGMFRGHLGGVLLISPTFYPPDYPGRISPRGGQGRLEQALALISEVHGDEQHILSQYFYGSLVTVSYDKGSQKRHCQESNL
ncbi:hypothetical protein T459_17108 [Capsicum annuum]|uniref:Uncharacterized protein n=1 Tax=Capsicum annuum TaxID=4072 RepID=A0A2G2ZAL8_CAPAN|nr:hypothetical protein T459_17108 [Capsicum annuum]